MSAIGPVSAHAQNAEALYTVSTAEAGEQQYSLATMSAASNVKQVWILFYGTDGYVGPVSKDGDLLFVGRGLVTDGRRLFLRDDSAVAVVDTPSSQRRMPATYRQSDAYLASCEKVVADIHARFPDAKVYLIGISNGSISVLHLARRMPSSIAGVVVIAGVYRDVELVMALQLTMPLLFVHHDDDTCVPSKFTPDFISRYHPVLVGSLGLLYGGRCGPYSAHQLHGQEKRVVDLLYEWALGKPMPTTIR